MLVLVILVTNATLERTLTKDLLHFSMLQQQAQSTHHAVMHYMKKGLMKYIDLKWPITIRSFRNRHLIIDVNI